MKPTKALITAVLLLLTMSLFAQDTTKYFIKEKFGNKTVSKEEYDKDMQKRKASVWLKNIWPDENKVSPERQKEVEKDCLAKYKELDPNQEWAENAHYRYRYNLNAKKELEKLGVRYEYMIGGPEAQTYKENTMQSQIVIIGRIEKIEKDPDNDSYFGWKFTVKPVRWVAGEKYFKTIPAQIYLVSPTNELYLRGYNYEEGNLEAGKEYLMFLARTNLSTLGSYSMEQQKEAKLPYKFHDYMNNPDVFPPAVFSFFEVRNGKLANLMYSMRKLPDEPIEEVLQNIKKIYDLNDPLNFFNRDYR